VLRPATRQITNTTIKADHRVESAKRTLSGDHGEFRWLAPLRNHTALILLVVLVIAGGFTSEVFLTPRNLLNILWAVSILGIVALGQTLLTCRFDMSVAAVVGFSGIVTVLAQLNGFDLYASIAIGLAAGATVGLCNGLMVKMTGANPFLITLGTNLLVYALALSLTHSRTLYATTPGFNTLGRGELFGFLHYSVVLFIGLAIALQLALDRTIFGRTIFVVGLNEVAGRLSGLRIQATKLVAFVLCSTLAALAGIVMTSRINSTAANSGFGMEFDSIIAAVLGGTSLFGGRGSMLRTVVGVVVLGVMNLCTAGPPSFAAGRCRPRPCSLSKRATPRSAQTRSSLRWGWWSTTTTLRAAQARRRPTVGASPPGRRCRSAKP
jgi:ribose/xylose/arabinose/galactoside ABC-type transport system permease subunit